jgi:hypothetical protein
VLASEPEAVDEVAAWPPPPLVVGAVADGANATAGLVVLLPPDAAELPPVPVEVGRGVDGGPPAIKNGVENVLGAVKSFWFWPT